MAAEATQGRESTPPEPPPGRVVDRGVEAEAEDATGVAAREKAPRGEEAGGGTAAASGAAAPPSSPQRRRRRAGGTAEADGAGFPLEAAFFVVVASLQAQGDRGAAPFRRLQPLPPPPPPSPLPERTQRGSCPSLSPLAAAFFLRQDEVVDLAVVVFEARDKGPGCLSSSWPRPSRRGGSLVAAAARAAAGPGGAAARGLVLAAPAGGSSSAAGSCGGALAGAGVGAIARSGVASGRSCSRCSLRGF